MKCIYLPLALVVFAVVGCSQSLSLRVLDRETEEPIPHVRVTHSHVPKPYFIVGQLVERELRTDARGYVELNARSGRIEIDAPGYASVRVAGEYGDTIWIWLDRESEDR